MGFPTIDKSPFFGGTNYAMQIRRTECAVTFNLWTVQRTWFWSLVYPDRDGGAIGAAASKAEAVGEAQAAIERLPEPGTDTGIPRASDADPSFTRPLQKSKDSHLHIGCKIDGATGEFACSPASPERPAKLRTMSDSYNDLWQVTLQQYAARIAAA
jgi:hypothetical protein